MTTKLLLCCLASTLVGCSAEDPKQPEPTGEPSPPTADTPANPRHGKAGAGDPYYPSDGNGGYDAAGYDVKVSYNPSTKNLAGVSTMTAKATQDLSRFNLDLRELKVESVAVNRQPAKFTRQGGFELVITPAKPIATGSKFTVEVRYAGQPGKEADRSGVGALGWNATPSGAAYALGEPHSAAFWFPVNETPRDTATFRLAARVPKGWTAVSIGRQGKTTSSKGWKTYRWVEPNPVASYLTTIAIDKFAVTKSKLSNGVPVVDAYAPGAGEKRQIAGRLDEVVKFLASKFGPYPQAAAGGIYMSANIPFALETNGRPTYASWAKLEVIVHEYAHQWFGNSVTLQSWSDICLNECFASYSEWLWAEAKDGADLNAGYRAEVEAASAKFWGHKLHQMGPGKEFDGVYDKGPLAMHALRAQIGEKTFARLLKQWPKEHRFGNASWREFEQFVEKLSGQNLDGFFDAWFRGTKQPAERYLYPGKLGG
jgi:aminopeptidase N